MGVLHVDLDLQGHYSLLIFFSLPPLFSLIPPDLSSSPSLYLFNFPPLFSLIPPDLSSSPLFIYLIFFFSATCNFFSSPFFFFSPAFFLLSFYFLLFFFSSTLTLTHCCRRYPLSPEIQTLDPTPPEHQAR
jgi:hypothetical protein